MMIIVWFDGQNLVAHRLVQRDRSGGGERLLTKGDNCSNPDRALTPEWVLGRVTCVFRPDSVEPVRDLSRLGLEARFWVLRWNLRRLPDALGRRLPAGLRLPLLRWRDAWGRCLSRGFEAIWLRR